MSSLRNHHDGADPGQRETEANMTTRQSAGISVMATTGQQLFIRYDAASNAMVFSESNWSADPVRSGVLPRTQLSKRVEAGRTLRLVARRAEFGPQAA